MRVQHFYGFFVRVAGFTVVWASEDDIGLVITIHGQAYIKLELLNEDFDLHTFMDKYIKFEWQTQTLFLLNDKQRLDLKVTAF